MTWRIEPKEPAAMLSNLKTTILATFGSVLIATLFIAAAASPALTPTMTVLA